MIDEIRMVAAFHTAFGQGVATKLGFPSPAVRSLRPKLLEEEVQELKEAIDDNDRVEIADALTDIGYIAAGTAVEYGLGLLPPTLVGMCDTQQHGDLYRAMEAPYWAMWTWTKPRFNAGFHRGDAYDAIATLAAMARRADDTDDLEGLRCATSGILREVKDFAYFERIPFEDCFEEVHSSNMSKLDENGKPLFREDGKILKSGLFRKPDLAAVLAKSRLG